MANREEEAIVRSNDYEDIFHKHHAQQKLKQIFASRKSIFQRRVKPVDSEEDEILSIEESIQQANKYIPHAKTNNNGKMPTIFSAGSTLTWEIVPEMVFMIVTFFDVIFSSYLIIMGLTGISWKSSIDAIVYEVADLPGVLNHLSKKIEATQPQGYQMVDFNIEAHGITLITVGVLHLINSVIGCQVSFRGMKKALILHAAIAFVLLITELTSGSIVYHSEGCNETQFHTRYIEHFINMYTSGTDSKLKIETIQLSLGCCGIENWQDYFQPFPASDLSPASKLDLAGEEVMIPPTCCNSWWIRNLQCASQVHLWQNKTSKNSTDDNSKLYIGRRLTSKGCLGEVETLCEKIIILMGYGVLISAACHACMLLITSICIVAQIRVITSMVKQNTLKAQQAEDLCMGVFDDEAVSSAGSSDEHEHDPGGNESPIPFFNRKEKRVNPFLPSPPERG